MQPRAIPASSREVLALRTRQRAEMNGQIVHDSIHLRDGWTISYLLDLGGVSVGFGSVAKGGPWKDKPTVFEFYVLPSHRTMVFNLFDAFLSASDARFFEVQSNDSLLTVILHTYGRDIVSEKIVFADQFITTLTASGAILRGVTPAEEIRSAIGQRRGGGEWILEFDGTPAATGGILFHYNCPYGDIYMEVAETFRRRGLGAYFVQELKRECYQLGAIPCARCNPTNIASRQTLAKAGFVPVAHILNAHIVSATKPSSDRPVSP